MWLTPVRASGHKTSAPKLFIMVELKRGHCAVRSTILAAPPAIIEDKSGGDQIEVGLDPIYDGVQPDVMQRCRAVMTCRRSKSQEVMAAT